MKDRAGSITYFKESDTLHVWVKTGKVGEYSITHPDIEGVFTCNIQEANTWVFCVCTRKVDHDSY